MNNNCKINNENCYEINNGENFQDKIVYNQIIQTYNDEILQLNLVNNDIDQGPIKNHSSNKQEDSRIENDDVEDEIDLKIIETYNKLMLKKKFHTSN
jgi:hypothetical protein